MSFLDASNLIFGDLLSDNNLKPVWEKFRGHFFSVTAVCALFMMYFTFSGTQLHCLPEQSNNANSTTKLSTVEAPVVNIYCAKQLPFYYGFSGPICLGITVFILMVSSFWLHLPGVSGPFSTLKEVEKTLSTLEMTLLDLKESCLKPGTEKPLDKQGKLREACMMLWNCRSDVGVRLTYTVRCIILEIALVISGSFVIWCTDQLRRRDNYTFHCSIERSTNLGIDKTIKTCVCTQNLITLRVTILATFAFSLVAQFILVLPGLFVVGKLCFKNVCTSCRREVKKDVIFMVTFWKHSRPVRSGILYDFIDYIFSDECLRKMKLAITKYSDAGNLQLIVPYSALGGKAVFAVLCDVVRDTRGKSWNEIERGIEQTLRDFDYKLQDCKKFVKITKRRKMWPLLVATLDRCRDARNYGYDFKCEWLRELQFNFDELSIGPPITSNGVYIYGSRIFGESLLYYALSKEHREINQNLTAAKLLLNNSRNNRVKYVHFRGKSQSMKQFLSEKRFRQLERFVDVPEKGSGGQRYKESLSQEKIRSLKERYSVDVTQNGPQALADANDILRGLKFSRWDDTAKALATLTSEEGHWNIFIYLLNAFIVTDKSRELECGVTHFEFDKLLWPRLFEYSKLPTDGVQLFVPTAVRHILTFCTTEQRQQAVVIVETTGDYLLSPEDRKNLISFVSELNNPPLANQPNDDDVTSDQPIQPNETQELLQDQ